MMRALDQNVVSNEAIIVGSPDDFVVPDIMWFENIKTAHWREDLTRSFRLFRDDPSHLHIAHAIPELLNTELKTGIIVTDVVHWERTEALRTLLKNDIFTEEIAANIERLRQAGLEPLVNLPKNRISLQRGLDSLPELVGEPMMSKLRAHVRSTREDTRKADWLELIEYAPSIAALADTVLPDVLANCGIADPQSSALLSRRSAFYRYQFCYWAHVFQYAMVTTEIGTSDNRLLNEFVDSDYALTGSFCDSLETSDDPLRQRFDALRSVI